MRDVSTGPIDSIEPFSTRLVNFVKFGSGTPIILLHGIAASLHDWDELLPDLAAHDNEVYALDLLGHGASAKPNSRTYHIDWVIAHFLDWMEKIGIPQPVT